MKKEFLIQQDNKQLFDQAARNQAAKRLKDLDNPYKQGSGNPTQKSIDELRSNLEKQVWQQKEEEINLLSQKLKSLSNANKSEKVGAVSDTYNYRDAEHNRIKQLEKQQEIRLIIKIFFKTILQFLYVRIFTAKCLPICRLY